MNPESNEEVKVADVIAETSVEATEKIEEIYNAPAEAVEVTPSAEATA